MPGFGVYDGMLSVYIRTAGSVYFKGCPKYYKNYRLLLQMFYEVVTSGTYFHCTQDIADSSSHHNVLH